MPVEEPSTASEADIHSASARVLSRGVFWSSRLALQKAKPYFIRVIEDLEVDAVRSLGGKHGIA
jgi:hypothetical protein